MKSSLQSALDYYVFIPLNKASKPSFYVLDIEIADHEHIQSPTIQNVNESAFFFVY